MVVNFIIQLALGLLLSVAVSAVQSLFTKSKETQEPGFRGEQTTGGDEPASFLIGTVASAGHFNYHGAWGEANKTPNAYYTQEVVFSDLPVTDMIGLFVDDEEEDGFNLASDEDTQGFPQPKFYSGRDHLWVRFFDGSQTSIDTFMEGKFGSDTDYPYTSGMIGRGLAKATFTALINRELWTGFPKFLGVFQGIPLYDPREDTTAGGSGSQRWDDQSTWAFSDNLAVMMYNVLRGIRYNNVWVWGGQASEWQVPYANWSAQMDICDQDIDLDGGGTEKRFRGGAEIRFDQQPIDVLNEMLKACSGRIAPIGGIYKLRIAEPASSSMSITDADFEVLRNSQTNELFPGLNDTQNSLTGTYREPSEGWVKKQLPVYAPAAYQSADDDRELPASMDLEYVSSNTQGQRVVKAALEDDRNWRRYAGTLPPAAWELEPLDTLDFTSDEEGYESKLFEIRAMDDENDAFQAVVLKEVSNADYSWTPASDEQSYSIVPLAIRRPPAQAIVAWSAVASSIRDNAGKPIRPAILFGYDGDLDDVDEVHFQARIQTGVEEMEPVYETFLNSKFPYIADPPAQNVGSAAIDAHAGKAVQARGTYVNNSGARSFEWSEWTDLTLADLKINTSDLAADLAARQADVETQVRAAIEQLELLSDTVARETVDQHQVYSRLGDSIAAVTKLTTVLTGENLASAEDLTLVQAQVDDVSAGGLIKITATAAPEGWNARASFVVYASGPDSFVQTGLHLDAKNDGTSRIFADASQFVFDGTLQSTNGATQINMSTGFFSITAVA